MNCNVIRSFLRTIGFPWVLSVRAYRAYRQMQNWRGNVVGGRLQIRTTLPKGIFAVDARSDLANVAFSGKYEEHLMNQLAIQAVGEGLIVNIGANIGFYAVQLARVFPRHSILAIEPNPEAFELLNFNIAQNGLEDRIQTMNVCISDTTGKIKLATIPGKAEFSSIGGIVHDAVSSQAQSVVEVDSVPLSALVEDKKVAMIMMDVEGAEVLVFQGSEKVLVNQHPLIICECEETLLNKFGHSSKQLVSMLEKYGYRVKDEKNPDKNIVFPFTGNIIAR